VAGTLRALSRVRLPNGHVLTTSLPDLAASVYPGDAIELQSAAHSLDAIDNALRATRGGSVSARDLGALDDVLSDSRFHSSESPWRRFGDWIGGLIDRVLSAISDFLQSLAPGTPSASLPTFFFALVFLVVVAASALLLIRAALRRTAGKASSVDEQDEPRTSVAAAERVDRHVAEGDYRLALRYLLLSTLLRLQELGALRLRPGLTNREYLRDLERELERTEAVAAPMGELIGTFDRTWYGHLPIDGEQYERCRNLATIALQAVERRGAA
jgi:hypothetical protein